jgi:hypothetical protein
MKPDPPPPPPPPRPAIPSTEERLRTDHRKILAANASPRVVRPLDVHRLAEIDRRLDWLEWTLTQDQAPAVTIQWRYLLTDTRDLLAAFAEVAH